MTFCSGEAATTFHGPVVSGQPFSRSKYSKLLQSFSVKQCLTYVLSLPIHCLTVGCTTVGQIEDDVRVAQQFKRYDSEEMAQIREQAQGISGPGLEDWKRDTQTAYNGRPTREYQGG